MKESVCDSGESVKVFSLRALRARAGGDHVVAHFWTSFGTNWDQSETNLRTNLRPIWDQFGTSLGPIWKTLTNLEPIWDQFGTTLESENEHFS